MSRLSIHTPMQQGPEVVRPGVVRSPLFRVQGLPAGSEATEALIATFRPQINAFTRQQRQAADLSGHAFYGKVRDLGNGILLRYVRQHGTEIFDMDTRGIPVRETRMRNPSKRVEIERTESTACVQRGGETYTYDNGGELEGILVRAGVWSSLPGLPPYNFYLYVNGVLVDEFLFRSVGPPPDNITLINFALGEGWFVSEDGLTLAEAGLTITPFRNFAANMSLGTNTVFLDFTGAYAALNFWRADVYAKWSIGGVQLVGSRYADDADLDPDPVWSFDITPGASGEGVKDFEKRLTEITRTTTLEIADDGSVQFTVDEDRQTTVLSTPGTGPNPSVAGQPFVPCP